MFLLNLCTRSSSIKNEHDTFLHNKSPLNNEVLPGNIFVQSYICSHLETNHINIIRKNTIDSLVITLNTPMIHITTSWTGAQVQTQSS